MPSFRPYNPKKEAEQIARALKRQGKLVEPNNIARSQAIEDLKALHHPAAIPHLVEALKDPHFGVSTRAAQALAYLNTTFRLRHADPRLRKHSDVTALGRALATVARAPKLPFEAFSKQKTNELYDAFHAARDLKRRK